MDQETEPLVTILTPVYNGQKHIKKCIQSVLSQSYSNWEYIIIDNQSTDDTHQIALALTNSDSRVKVVKTPEFVTSVQNHNFALTLVSKDSEYTKIAHADDLLLPECIERMVKVGESNKNIGLIGAYRLDENEVGHDGLPYPVSTFTGKEIGRGVFLAKYDLFGNPTSTMVRSKILQEEKGFYNEGNIHYDTEACFKILCNWDFGFVHQILTYTSRHQGSITSSIGKLNSYFIASFSCLLKYGDNFFDETEFVKIKKYYTSTYYRRYASGLLKNKNPEMIQYHKSEREKVGLKISKIRVVYTALGLLVDKYLSIKKWKEAFNRPVVLKNEFD